MPESDIRTLVSLEADQSGVDAARRALKQVEKDQRELVDAFKRGEIEVEDYNKALRDLKKNEQSLSSAIDSATGEISAQKKAMREAADEAKRFADSQAELATAQGNFDVVSQNVALSGDVESGIRTLSGAGSAFGIAGAEKLALGGEIFAIIEAAPKLKAALAGIPDVLKSVVKEIGPAGLIGGGVLIGAFLALGQVIKFLTRDVQDHIDARVAEADAIGEATSLLLSGATQGQVSDRLRQTEIAQAAAQASADSIQQSMRDLSDAFAEGGDLNSLGFAQELRGLDEEFSKAEATVDSYGALIAELTSLLESGKLPIEETKEVEEQLAEARKETVAITKAATRAAQASAKEFKQTGIAFTAASFGLLGTDPAETAAKKKKAEELAEALAEIEHDAAQDELKLRSELAEQRFQLELGNFRDIEDSIRDFGRDRRDALEEGNFLQLRDINKAEKRATADRLTELQRGQADITREGNAARRELQAQTASSMRELNEEVARGLQAVVNQFSVALASIAGTSSAPRVPFGVSLFATAPRTSS